MKDNTGGQMSDLEQKKFYSNDTTNKIIQQFADDNNMGFSEALRTIILNWWQEWVNVPVIGTKKEE